MEIQKPKVKIKDEKLEFFIVNKNTLKNIVKSDELIDNINDVVSKVNKIIIQASQFINLFFIHLYDYNKPFPIIDKQFVLTIFKVITKKDDGRGKKSSDETIKLIKELEQFYLTYYKQCIIDADIISIDNRKQGGPTLIRVTDLMGRDVHDYVGIILFIYSDGTIIKRCFYK